jgi:large subunit ribosomal protein L21
MMFAVIRTGGKQYRVAADETLKLQKLAGEPGDAVSFSDVLAHGGDSPVVGAPLVSGASVNAEIVAHGRDGKIIVFKKRRRQNSRRRNGHRQDYTLVRITEILTKGAKSERPTRKAKATATETAASDAVARKPRAKRVAKKDETGAEGASE